MSDDICRSVRSQKHQEERCKNKARPESDFCGIHVNSAVRWKSLKETATNANRIKTWWRSIKPLYQRRLHGPAFFDRSLCVNSEDFFSTDAVAQIPAHYFLSFKDADGLVYGFDARSWAMLVDKSAEKHEAAKNPYTRNEVNATVLEKAGRLVEWLRARKYEILWTPTVPISPEQVWRMKVVEIFVVMEELEYGADPEWFISLSLSQQKEFYMHLLDIWNHRAGLSQAERERIVPSTQILFPWAISRIAAIQQLSTIRSTNTSVMRRLVTTATERSDRILGAMYILTALTQVCSQAAESFPWLYESASEYQVQHEVQWVHTILAAYLQNL